MRHLFFLLILISFNCIADRGDKNRCLNRVNNESLILELEKRLSFDYEPRREKPRENIIFEAECVDKYSTTIKFMQVNMDKATEHTRLKVKTRSKQFCTEAVKELRLMSELRFKYPNQMFAYCKMGGFGSNNPINTSLVKVNFNQELSIIKTHNDISIGGRPYRSQGSSWEVLDEDPRFKQSIRECLSEARRINSRRY